MQQQQQEIENSNSIKYSAVFQQKIIFALTQRILEGHFRRAEWELEKLMIIPNCLRQRGMSFSSSRKQLGLASL
jgi:hypothetical protein